MVKNLFSLFFSFFTFFSTHALCSATVTADLSSGTTLGWNNYSSLEPEDTLQIILPDSSAEATLFGNGAIVIANRIECNGKLKISTPRSIIHKGTITASEVILEATTIILEDLSVINATCKDNGGNVYIGGGWQGADANIQNAEMVMIEKGAKIVADGGANGNGGVVVVWSEISTHFQGNVSATGRGSFGSGGKVEISSRKFLHFDGNVDVNAEIGNPGRLLLDPVSITIQSLSPDINGNGSGLDITNINQLNNATTTPLGFPNANSIITAGALNGLFVNNVIATLAAQTFITVNAAINTAATNVTLTLASPTVNLNSAITLGAGGTLTGTGVNTVNVGPSGSAQNGIDIVSTGGVVNLATATYTAPLNIANNLILNGNGQANTTILVTGAVPSHSSRNPAIYVQGGSNVVIQNLTVDGNNVGFPTNANITGIFYVNAGGTITNTHILNIANSPTPYGGGQQGVAIRVSDTLGGPFVLNINANSIDHFQKAAIVIDGPQVTVNMTNNTVTGVGPSTPASIGIQISDCTGTISANTVTNLVYSDHQSTAAILALNPSPNLAILGNIISNSDAGIVVETAAAGLNIENNNIQNSGDVGIGVYDTSGIVHVLSNTLTNNGGLSANANTGIYLFSSTSQPFDVTTNTITPAPGTSAIFTQGAAAGLAPIVDLTGNTFVDP